MSHSLKRWCIGVWVGAIVALAALHALHLSADFPNFSPWFMDWAKYTDEGWFGNGAVRMHVLGTWYVAGDFNPAAPLPVWPFLEWLVFAFSGVNIEAARGLAVDCYFVNLALVYRLIRFNGSQRGPQWAGLLAVTLLVSSPFLYCFTRLAILEPMLMLLFLAALNIAVRVSGFRRPILGAATVGLLFTLMMLTKTTAIFLLPAVAWALLLPYLRQFRRLIQASLAAGLTFAGLYGSWLALLTHRGLMGDYKYLYSVNDYSKPPERWWPVVSSWWSFHGALWVDRILIPLAGFVILITLAAGGSSFLARRTPLYRTNLWARRLLLDPIFGACFLGTAGYIVFMTLQNHPQPRYFAMVTYMMFILLAKGAAAMLSGDGARGELYLGEKAGRITARIPVGLSARKLGVTIVSASLAAIAFNTVWTVNYAMHPQYTFVTAARRLTEYIDNQPNGNRLLLSISGDEISLITQIPALCDDFVSPTARIPDLPAKLAVYQPGWYASWNDIDPGTLIDLHTRYSIEQVATFPAFDDPDRNLLVLFKLHPLPGGAVRAAGDPSMQAILPEDKFTVPVE